VVGVDASEELLAAAAVASSSLGPRASWLVGDARRLPAEWAGRFDAVVNRHMIHLFPAPEVRAIVAESARVLKPGEPPLHLRPERRGSPSSPLPLVRAIVAGGVFHCIAEDYGLITFAHPTGTTSADVPAGFTPSQATAWLDADVIWKGAVAFGDTTGGDWRVGRKMATYCRSSGAFAGGVRQAHLAVDSAVDGAAVREVFASWRDSYEGILAAHSGLGADVVAAGWDGMMTALGDTGQAGHAVWLVPCVSAFT
jgi:SAM-dependent methyltransferase